VDQNTQSPWNAHTSTENHSHLVGNVHVGTCLNQYLHNRVSALADGPADGRNFLSFLPGVTHKGIMDHHLSRASDMEERERRNPQSTIGSCNTTHSLASKKHHLLQFAGGIHVDTCVYQHLHNLDLSFLDSTAKRCWAPTVLQSQKQVKVIVQTQCQRVPLSTIYRRNAVHTHTGKRFTPTLSALTSAPVLISTSTILSLPFSIAQRRGVQPSCIPRASYISKCECRCSQSAPAIQRAHKRGKSPPPCRRSRQHLLLSAPPQSCRGPSRQPSGGESDRPADTKSK
jgi:hypothetical protein